MNLTGKELLIGRTLMKKCPFSIMSLIMYFRISFPIICDDKKPPWCNKNIINLIMNKSIFYKSHTANENSSDKTEAIKAFQNKLTSPIENAKSQYYSKLSTKLRGGGNVRGGGGGGETEN